MTAAENPGQLVERAHSPLRPPTTRHENLEGMAKGEMEEEIAEWGEEAFSLLHGDELLDSQPQQPQPSLRAQQPEPPPTGPGTPWHRDIKISEDIMKRAAAARRLAQQAMSRLQKYGTEEEYEEPNEEWRQKVEDVALKKEQYVPGGIVLFEKGWQTLLANNKGDETSDFALTVIRDGYKPEFVEIASNSQQAHPSYKEKQRVVREQLRSTVSGASIEEFLEGSEPHTIFFRNMKSAERNDAFVDKEVAALERYGTIKRWDSERLGEPRVISPLGVAINRSVF